MLKFQQQNMILKGYAEMLKYYVGMMIMKLMIWNGKDKILKKCREYYMSINF